MRKLLKSDNVKYVILLLASTLVFGLDLLSKWLVRKCMTPVDVIGVIPGCFDLVFVQNRGAAFGFLNRQDIEWQFWLFLAATILAAVIIVLLTRGAKNQPLLVMGLGMILGGAAGNLLDRVRYRAVLDFLDIYWQNWHWPAFNIADTGICLGAFFACIAAWRKKPGVAP